MLPLEVVGPAPLEQPQEARTGAEKKDRKENMVISSKLGGSSEG